MYIRGPCPPWTRPIGTFLTHARVLAYAFVTVKCQLRSSIIVPRRRALSVIGLHWKVPQIGVLGAILGVGANMFGGNPLGMQRLPIYAFSDIFGPDLTRRVVAFGKGIAICHRRKCGQAWGFTAPLPEVVGKLRIPLDLLLPHGKIAIILRCNPWAVGSSLEGTFYGFCVGKIGQNPKIGQLWSPVAPQPYVVQKSWPIWQTP